MKLYKVLIGLMLCFTFGCNVKQSSSDRQSLSSDTIRYAQGFTIHYFDDYASVEVRDPWDSTRILQRYLLVDLSMLPLSTNWERWIR